MKLEKIFKVLILSKVTIILFNITIEIFFPSSDIPQELQLKYVQPTNDISFSFFILIFIGYIWSLFKLYKFRNSGRNIYLAFHILTFPLIIFFGNTMETPWVNILSTVDENITGFMIALMYFSPLKEKFT